MLLREIIFLYVRVCANCCKIREDLEPQLQYAHIILFSYEGQLILVRVSHSSNLWKSFNAGVIKTLDLFTKVHML